jgi:hypothetical protein
MTRIFNRAFLTLATSLRNKNALQSPIRAKTFFAGLLAGYVGIRADVYILSLRAAFHTRLDTQVARSPAHCAEDPVLD